MSAPPAPAEPTAHAARRPHDAEYYRLLLDEVADMSADILRRVHREVTADTAAPDAAGAATIAFDRIARTLRRTINLGRAIEQQVAVPQPGGGQHREAARRRIIRDVEDAIQRTAGDDEAEDLHAEFLERLDAPDIDDDIDHRPLADIIAGICRDLGIAGPFIEPPPWKRRTPADIATLCARAANPPPSTGQPTAPASNPATRLLSPARFRGK